MHKKVISKEKMDEAIAKIYAIFIECGLGPSIPDNSKVGQAVVRPIPSKKKAIVNDNNIDELEKKAMEIINKRPDKKTFMKFLELRKEDMLEIFKLVIESPNMPLSAIETWLLPEY